MSETEKYTDKTVVVLCGGTSSEAEVSLVSGRAVAAALEALGVRSELVRLDADALPAGLSADRTIVFPALHGGYGEGGALQRDLEAAGIAYVGSDAQSSELCMDKVAAKRRVGGSGFALAASVAFTTARAHPAPMLWAALGESGAHAPAQTSSSASASAPAASGGGAVGGSSAAAQPAHAGGAVLKPRSGGSSVGLFLLDNVAELEQVLPALDAGEWLLEGRVFGREMTIGVLGGKAQAIVEIVPEGGVYDFTRKYRAGSTRYLFPAPLEPELTAQIAEAAERAFALCGCRDFGRIDFILDAQGRVFFLEVNTLPGLTPTSLLPKSASALGLDFNALIRRMLEPALQRANWRWDEILTH